MTYTLNLGPDHGLLTRDDIPPSRLCLRLTPSTGRLVVEDVTGTVAGEALVRRLLVLLQLHEGESTPELLARLEER